MTTINRVKVKSFEPSSKNIQQDTFTVVRGFRKSILAAREGYVTVLDFFDEEINLDVNEADCSFYEVSKPAPTKSSKKRLTVAQCKKLCHMAPKDMEGWSYMCKLNHVRGNADALLEQGEITKGTYDRLYDYAKSVADRGTY